MLNTKTNMKRYLGLIAPWMSGDWNEKTMNDESFIKQKSDPAYAIFEIPSRPLPGWFESMLLGKDNSDNLAFVISWVTRINTTIARYNMTDTDRLGAARVLHAGIAVFKPEFLNIWENL
jgi:hypothetical protein